MKRSHQLTDNIERFIGSFQRRTTRVIVDRFLLAANKIVLGDM